MTTAHEQLSEEEMAGVEIEARDFLARHPDYLNKHTQYLAVLLVRRAFATIRALRSQLAEAQKREAGLREALENLLDEQNVEE